MTRGGDACYNISERMGNRLYIFDCLDKKLRVADASFMTIGRGQGNVFRCKMRAESGGSFALRGGVCRFFPHSSVSQYSFNGVQVQTEVQLQPGVLNLFVVEGGCFLGWMGDEDALPDFGALNPDEWYVYDKATAQWSNSMRLEDIHALPETPRGKMLVVFKGLTSCAFEFSDIQEVARFVVKGQGEPHRESPAPHAAANVASQEADAQKEVCCPHCWQRFPVSHALAISAHPKLMGDTILGKDARQRFTPLNVDTQGVPVDAMGMSVREYACPWCHQKLPSFFMRTRQMIFSLVGMPGAGKTYYLTTMLHELEYALPREFGIAFRDSDSSGNAPLNSMRIKLFSATSPQEAILEQTSPDSEFYHEVWRDGQHMRAPRPFIYNMSRESKAYTMVLYDTAGASYELDGVSDKKIAGHLEAASAIFFLFDPTADIAFRKIIKTDGAAPMANGHPKRERQALMLSEVEMSVRAALHLPPEKKLDVPLAVIIGKSDIWQDLLGSEPLLPSVRNGQFQPKFVDANSTRLRQFLFNISPNICTNAEAISKNVHYFAVSSFGSATVNTTDEHGNSYTVPTDGKVRPNRVSDPVLWALYCKEPSLLRKNRN